MKQKKATVCFLMVLGVLAVCCSGRVPVFPVGAYVADALGQEFVLDFAGDGSYSAVLAGKWLVAEGAYQPSGSAITFAADPPCTDEATYVWTLDGEILTFEASGTDLCRDRRDFLQDTIYTCVTCT